jgi:hypothetical protein
MSRAFDGDIRTLPTRRMLFLEGTFGITPDTLLTLIVARF